MVRSGCASVNLIRTLVLALTLTLTLTTLTLGTKRVCFRKAAVTILGAAAPIAVASWDTECFGTSLVRAYADLVVRSLGLHYANKGRDQKTVVVTYNTRRTQSQWPERQVSLNFS